MEHTEIQTKCKEVFDEIKQIQAILKWNNSQLYEKTYIILFNNEDFATDEKKQLQKFTDKTKKIFSRKNWAKNKASSTTLQALENILNAIYKCDDYKHSELHDSLLSLESINAIRKASDELERWLKMQDNEK